MEMFYRREHWMDDGGVNYVLEKLAMQARFYTPHCLRTKESSPIFRINGVHHENGFKKPTASDLTNALDTFGDNHEYQRKYFPDSKPGDLQEMIIRRSDLCGLKGKVLLFTKEHNADRHKAGDAGLRAVSRLYKSFTQLYSVELEGELSCLKSLIKAARALARI